ncbi:hypothetical protein EDD55_102229 [Varunaivibrio sulfuroxidans]|uniref:Divergent polysaccharide deacetylase family protein n=2 Tax=Varunaivibrio sulfuroxidans TaxID=1773489 RepID=A0A4R3JEG7_9PROT|nr:hypothetical protein EDD55_102229 [Varunaivibrio sulfuroxidans]
MNAFKNRTSVVVVAAVVLVGAVAMGYYWGEHAAPLQMAGPSKVDKIPAPPSAWFTKNAVPPKMVVRPDTPIFPDEAGPTGARGSSRPYEEPLPQETYMPSHDIPAIPTPGIANAPPTGSPLGAPGGAMPPAAPVKAPWRRYAMARGAPSGRPLVAIVIDDMGVDHKRSLKMVAMPAPLTLSYLTYAPNIKKQTAAARAAGHELMLHVSMEPGSHAVDPGPNVLLTGESDTEIRSRLDWGLNRFSTYIGINNHMGSKFTADATGMRVVMEELKKRGLIFLDSRTTNKTVGAQIAHELGVTVVERNIFLDNVNAKDAILKQLAALVRVARHKGAAIAIGHPRDGTIAALKAWLPTAVDLGVDVVPLSAVIEKMYALKPLPDVARVSRR